MMVLLHYINRVEIMYTVQVVGQWYSKAPTTCTGRLWVWTITTITFVTVAS